MVQTAIKLVAEASGCCEIDWNLCSRGCVE